MNRKRSLNDIGRNIDRMLREGENARWGPCLKILYFGAMAEEHSYRTMGAWVDMGKYDRGECVAMPHGWSAHIAPEWCAANYSKEGNPRGSYCLTLTTVQEVLGRRHLVQWETEMLYANIGHHEWSVAAMILGLNSMKSATRDDIISANWHLVPLVRWRIVFKPHMVALRRCTGTSRANYCSGGGMDMRKMLNCTYRSADDADWETVMGCFTGGGRFHVMLADDGRGSHARWSRGVYTAALRMADVVVGQVATAGRVNTVVEYWESRWGWAPSGSTSNKAAVKEMRAEHKIDDKAVRGNKKSVFNSLPDGYIEQIMAGPAVDVCRCSTKCEPGGKQRDLEAHCDEAFVVAAYASLDVEKHMNYEGMVAKQTPADVCRWTIASNMMGPEQCWLSMDYTAYNLGHSTADLQTLSRTYAIAWERAAVDKQVASEKAAAHRWVARSLGRRFMVQGNKVSRCMSGLWSGHRNTSRDNTQMHEIHSELALSDVALLTGRRVEPVYKGYSGDDEDILFEQWTEALLYYSMSVFHGHELGPAKQMAGRSHEFLQRISRPGEHCIRPMWAMLAQTASGNWYKDAYVWYGNAVAAVSDNCWGMYTRGMPVVWARALAYSTLNAQMRVPTDEGWHLLEWWRYRHGSAGHPLWAGTGGEIVELPKVTAKYRPRGKLGFGTIAWMNKCERVVNTKIPLGRREGYGEMLSADVNSRLYEHDRLRTQRTETLQWWPERGSTVYRADMYQPAINAIPMRELLNEITAHATDRRPATAEEVASRFGVDMEFIKLVGGFDWLVSRLPSADVCKYEAPVERHAVAWKYYNADDAVTSWAVNSKAVAMKRPRPVMKAGQKGDMDMVITYAPNAAGKTHYTRAARRNGKRVLDVDDDQVLATLLRTRHGYGALAHTAVRDTVVAYVTDLVERRMYDEVVSQFPFGGIVDTRTEAAQHVRYRVVCPEDSVLEARQRARGWTQEDIQRRRHRWDVALSNYERFNKEHKIKAHYSEEW